MARFSRRYPETVDAVQFDGTRESFDELAARLPIETAPYYNGDRSIVGVETMHIRVEQASVELKAGSWLVFMEENQLGVFTDEVFQRLFTPLPE